MKFSAATRGFIAQRCWSVISIHGSMIRKCASACCGRKSQEPMKAMNFCPECIMSLLQSVRACQMILPAMALSRKATWLSANYFMTNLLERKDRMSMYSAVEVRVPFADHRLIEHVYNVPWEYKFDPSEGVGEKSLLRSAVRDLLPDKILRRKKSPYPKTHHPAYEERITAMLGERLARPESVLHELLDRTKLENVLRGENVTWFGQLMSRPQLIAWLYQVDVWFDEYNIDLAL